MQLLVSAMATKLNSMRLLERHHIPYLVCTYPYDPEDPPDAVQVAQRIGYAPHEVFKTIVVTAGGTSRPLLIMLGADRQIDLKRAAVALGHKRLELMPRTEAERLTGLKVGGIGALALSAKPWPSYLDRGAEGLAQIFVNAGQRGVMLGVAVEDLRRVLNAAWIDAAN